MSDRKGGWEVISTAYPPTTFRVGDTVGVWIHYYDDTNEPVPVEDKVVISLTRVNRYKHVTVLRGIVMDGAVYSLLSRSVTVCLAENTRKGCLELDNPFEI